MRDDLGLAPERLGRKTGRGLDRSKGLENPQCNLEEPSPVHKYKTHRIIHGYHDCRQNMMLIHATEKNESHPSVTESNHITQTRSER